MSTLWEIAPHTRAKHRILNRYLGAWFAILGRHHKSLNYIDGFAGPGEYTNSEIGSPIIALRVANGLLNSGALARDTRIQFVFVEEDEATCSHLEKKLASENRSANIEIQVINGAFREVIEPALSELEGKGRQLVPSFFFVDPFGFGGIPFTVMQRILRYPRCEVFVNLMIDYINRFVRHPNERIRNLISDCFGRSDVEELISGETNRTEALLQLYKQQLLNSAKYVKRFDMFGLRNRLIYSLFFASKSPAGFKKMKEAMWSVDKNTGGLFSDTDPSGVRIFDLFETERLWSQLSAQFAGKETPMKKLEDWVIEETEYLSSHLRQVLRSHEDKDITVTPMPNYIRRRGTYPTGKVIIRFKV